MKDARELDAAGKFTGKINSLLLRIVQCNRVQVRAVSCGPLSRESTAWGHGRAADVPLRSMVRRCTITRQRAPSASFAGGCTSWSRRTSSTVTSAARRATRSRAAWAVSKQNGPSQLTNMPRPTDQNAPLRPVWTAGRLGSTRSQRMTVETLETGRIDMAEQNLKKFDLKGSTVRDRGMTHIPHTPGASCARGGGSGGGGGEQYVHRLIISRGGTGCGAVVWAGRQR
jgi:hypothetical protein